MRVGIVILPEHRWWAAEPKWRGAEEHGFDHAWTYDHLGWRTLVDGPWFDAIPTLTAAAMVTSEIRLGTFVVSPNFRHPVPLARQVLAVDDISDGRFMLGIGSGASGLGGYDRQAMGHAGEDTTPAQVADRFAEFVELTDSLLTCQKTTFSGEHYRTEEARSAPGCVQQPRVPFLIAANGPRAMGLAARFGQGWVTTGSPEPKTLDDWWADVAKRARRFERVLVEQDRDPATVDRYVSVDASPVFSLSSVDAFTEHVGRARDAGFTDVVVHWPRPDGPYAGRETVLEQVAADVLPLLGGRATRRDAENSAASNGTGTLGV